MLNNIRKTSDSWLMRAVLAMIAFAFIGWGIKDVLLSTNNYDLITFSDAKTITEEDFLQARAEQIRNIQTKTGINLTEKELTQLNINNLVLRNLINERMFAYLTNYYDLDLSDDTVIKLLRESPDFKNEHGLFDVAIFENFIKHSYSTEEEYLTEVKNGTLKSVLISIFLETFSTPQIMLKNITNYMSESRDVDLVEIDLTRRSKNLNLPSPTNEQLEDLYKRTKETFASPEKRSLIYFKVSRDILQKQLQDSKNELSQTEKLDQQFFTTIKNLEDDVAGGSSLLEIANKYELPIEHLDTIGYDELTNNNSLLSPCADTIFELDAKEVSYPIELPDNKTFVLVEIKSIEPSKIPEFQDISDQVKKLWVQQYIRNANLQTIQQIAKEYKVANKNNAFPEVTIDTQASFIRSKIDTNKALPPELISMIFQTDIGSNTAVFQQENKAYFAYVKHKQIDKKQNEEILQNNLKTISAAIKNNIIDELIIYALKKNKMKILKQFPN